jgi:hypothetical protein
LSAEILGQNKFVFLSAFITKQQSHLNYMKHSTFILFVIFFFIVSCKKDKSDAENSGGTNQMIMPLKHGNIWNYRRIEFPQLDTSYYSTWISGDSTVGSETWFKQYHDSITCFLILNKSNGLHQISRLTGNDELIYKYPAVIGDEYGTSDGLMTVQNLSAYEEVPAGRFSCYEYKNTQLDNIYFMTYCSPGTGVIKLVLYSGTDILFMDELMSYHLE